MARFAASVSVSVFLFLFVTLSHARHIQDSFPEPKPESEAASHPEPNHKPQPHDTVSFTLDSVDPVPLTLLHFRPINRHLHPGRPLLSQLPLTLRNSHRRCRHGHRRQIPYGNDAIVLSDAADRRIPPRLVRVHSSVEPLLPEMISSIASDPDHEYRHHIHSEHHHHRHHNHEEGWFAKKIRKFMNLF